MTDNEIKKALENCLDYSPSCATCKYDADTLTSSECMGALMKDCLDLINRQKAEIERLNIECQSMRNAANSYKMHYETAKSEAIKEFAEKLKNCFAISGDYLDIINIIDNLVKEMTEEETNQRKEDENE